MFLNRRQFLTTTVAFAAGSVVPILKAESNISAHSSDQLPIEGHLPSLQHSVAWLNSRPLATADLRGRVVLVYFWTYTCINSLRALPFIRAWAEKYRTQGLLVIGIHTPEFSFEHQIANVRTAVAALRLTTPIVVDSNYAIWQAFGNQYWPAFYFADAAGRIRHQQFGEGKYEDSERAIQLLLAEMGTRPTSEGFTTVHGEGIEAPAAWNSLQSPETYVGATLAQSFAGVHRGHTYQLPSRLALNQWALAGDWARSEESATLTRSNGRIAFRFHARDLHLVMAPSTPAVLFGSEFFSMVRSPSLRMGATLMRTGWELSLRPGSIKWSGRPDQSAIAYLKSNFLMPAPRSTISPSADESQLHRSQTHIALTGVHLEQPEIKKPSRRQLLALLGSSAAAMLKQPALLAKTAFGPVKQIDAGDLSIGYVEAGRSDAPVIILLHGWPYDIHSYAEVTPILAAAGYRVIVPYLRGYGTTRFRAANTARNAQQAAFATDIIALMDALHVQSAVIGGFDWGARTADIVAALWPQRCRALVSVSGYLIGSQAANQAPLPPAAELSWWYQFYFATDRGRAGYEHYRKDFAKVIWKTASPKWNFTDEIFQQSAAALDNPDHVAITIHNYRWRLGLASGDPKLENVEKKLAQSPVITVPTITLEGDANGAPHPDPLAYASKFSGPYSHRVVTGGIGHNLPQEAPREFARAMLYVAARGKS